MSVAVDVKVLPVGPVLQPDASLSRAIRPASVTDGHSAPLLVVLREPSCSPDSPKTLASRLSSHTVKTY
eukprot:1994825-Pyramimonas_sp.AAC.1